MAKTKFYGWIAVFGAAMCYFCFCGCIYYSYGVFLPVICDDLGWSRGEVSGALTAYMLVGGFLGPVVGLTITRFGARKNIIIGNLIAGLGLLAIALVKEAWQLYLIFGVIIGAGNSFGGFIAATTVASNWFLKRRSLAISIVISSGGIAGFIFPLVVGWLIPIIGWRLSYVVLGGVFVLLGVIISGIMVRNKPEDMGQVPDGQAAGVTVEGSAAQSAESRVYQTSVNWNVTDAMRTRAFWLILVFCASSSFSLNILTSNSVAYLRDIGFSPIIAAGGLSLLVGMSTFGKFLAGALGTRFEIRHLSATFLGAFAIGIFVLMNVKDVPLIYVYAIISGISYGGLIVFMPAILGDYYGRANYHKIIGWMNPFTAIISAFSPMFAGFIFDVTRSYTFAFSVAICFLVVGIICAILARPPRPKQVLTGQPASAVVSNGGIHGTTNKTTHLH
jgi:MFS family permease